MDIGNLGNEIQSWVAVRSFAVEDANPQLPIIDANELAEMLSRVFKKLDGCVVVPVEPTPKMIDSTWDDQDEIDTMSHNTRNEFIYKKMIAAAQEKNQ